MIEDRPELEVARLGAASVVHSRRSGAMTLANDAALELTRDALLGADAPAGEEAGRLLEDWRRAGLFEPRRRPFPDPVAWRAPQAEAQLFALDGRRAALRCEDAALAEDLALALAPMRAEAGGEVAARVDLLCEGDGFAVFRNGAPSWGRGDVFVARHCALRETLTALQGPERVGAVLHAAAVARGDAALVLAGDSGAGKSTLAMRLIARGWRQAADDLAGLDGQGGVLPFPTRVSLKPGSWPLADRRALAAAPTRGVGGMRARYLDAPARAAPGRTIRARALVFPDYRPGAEARAEPLAPEEAFLRLIDCGARVAGAANSVAGLARFVRETPAHRLIHGGGAAAERACEALFEDAGGRAA